MCPRYDYRCKKCGENFEAIRKIDDRKTADCPKCGAVAEQKVSNPLSVKTYGVGYHKKDTGDWA